MTLLNVDTLERYHCDCDGKGLANATPVKEPSSPIPAARP
jgi:hypothetical protein